MRPSSTLEQIPVPVAQLERKIAQGAPAGIDVISLASGIRQADYAPSWLPPSGRRRSQHGTGTRQPRSRGLVREADGGVL